MNWKREYSLFYGTTALYSLQRWAKEALGKDIVVRGEGVDGWFTVLSTKGTMQELKTWLFERMKENLSYVQDELKQTQISGEKLVSFTKSSKINLKTSDQELILFYEQFVSYFDDYIMHLWYGFYLPEIVSDLFQELLKKKIPSSKINEAIETYSIPSQKAAVLKISQFFSQEKDKEKRIQYIKKNYPWLMSTDPFTQPSDDKWIESYVSSFGIQAKKSMKSLGLEHEPLIKIYQDVLYLKDKRDEYRREAFYFILPLLKEISRRKGISLIGLGYLLPDELNSSDLGLMIEQRKEGYIIEINGKERVIEGGKSVISKFIQTQQANDSTIKGIIGCPGFIKGRVQIIHHKKDLASFKEGNILVATTTNPDYIPAMQKASAFITDEGGITCHAAIVARELKKPCIVGTKIATKTFKNGDLVEVDAEKGIVRKL